MGNATIEFLQKQIQDLANENAKAREFVVKSEGAIAAYQIALKQVQESEERDATGPEPSAGE